MPASRRIAGRIVTTHLLFPMLRFGQYARGLARAALVECIAGPFHTRCEQSAARDLARLPLQKAPCRNQRGDLMKSLSRSRLVTSPGAISRLPAGTLPYCL